MDMDASSLSTARRNLVFISIAFILVALGDANLVTMEGKSTVKILFGTMEFNKPCVLKIFAWVLLGWFLLRFCQFSRYKEEWFIYCNAMYNSGLMEKIVKEKGQKKVNNIEGHQRHQNFFNTWVWPTTNIEIKVEKTTTKSLLFMYVAFSTEYFGQYYFPYFLVITAIIINLTT